MRRTDAGTLIVNAAPEDGGPDPGCGFLVLDSSCNPMCANAEAVRIFTHPDGAKTKLTAAVAKKIRSALFEQGVPNQASLADIARRLVSGRRRYFCRVFMLDTFERPNAERFIGVLLERSGSSSAWVSKIATEFSLTPRERQSLALLGQGLSSRQMADRMGISPNTVKAFLRVIMIKMGVSSRSSILGKVLAARGSDGMSSVWPARPAAPPRAVGRK